MFIVPPFRFSRTIRSFCTYIIHERVVRVNCFYKSF
nr:MAG TPA: hypothetical protein [Caudoviricetes sp.]DAZ20885.1 MAG TPA: hypothetical protein [Caudoviricetes sp.]